MDILKNTAGNILSYNGTPLGTTWGVAPTPGIPTDYIAFWQCDGDWTDETGNWNMSGVNSPTFGAGLFSKQAGEFLRSSNQYAATASHMDTYFAGGDSYTVSVWMKSRTIGTRNYWIGAADGTGNPWTLGAEGAGNNMYGWAGVTLNPSENPYDGAWHNFTLRVDSAGGSTPGADLWMDGLQVLTPLERVGTIYTKGQTVKLGAGGGVSSWDGWLQYCRIYDYALTDENIVAIAAET